MAILKREVIGNQTLILESTFCDGVAHVQRGSSLLGSQVDCLPCLHSGDERFHLVSRLGQGVLPSKPCVRVAHDDVREPLMSVSHIRSRHATCRCGIRGGRGRYAHALRREGTRSFAPARASGTETVLGVPFRSRIGKAKGDRRARLMGGSQRGPKQPSGHSGCQLGQGLNTSGHWMRCA